MCERWGFLVNMLEVGQIRICVRGGYLRICVRGDDLSICVRGDDLSMYMGES